MEIHDKDSVISFFTEDIKFRLVNEPAIIGWLSFCVKQFDKLLGTINIIFCSDEYLYKMNVDYLNHDTYTDVITFDYGEENIVSGDVFISIDRVNENALEFGVDADFELKRVMVHGVLHLCGFKDKSKEDQQVMTQKEDYCLNLFKN